MAVVKELPKNRVKKSKPAMGTFKRLKTCIRLTKQKQQNEEINIKRSSKNFIKCYILAIQCLGLLKWVGTMYVHCTVANTRKTI